MTVRIPQRVLLFITLVAAALLTAPAAHALPNRADDAVAGVDGAVYSIVRTADRIYVGGSFGHVTAHTGPFAMTDATGAPRLPAPQVSGGGATVDAAVPDGAGGFYIGGDFTHVGGVVRHDVARIRADGSVDPDFDPNASDVVEAIQRSGSTVYLGGRFHTLNGNVPRSYLAAVDATTGRVANGFAPSLDQPVSSLSVAGSSVYFAYSGTVVNGVPRSKAAAVDGTSGATLAWNPSPDDLVATVVAAGDRVYLGGLFRHVGGTARARFAATDAITGADLGVDLGLDGPVFAILVRGSTLYLGGQFTHTGATAVGSAAAFSTSGVLQTAWAPAVNGYVWSLADDGGSGPIYLGGVFGLAGGAARSDFAAVDRATGAATGWVPQTGSPGSQPVIALSAGTVAIGGTFHALGGVVRQNAAAFSALDGSLLPWDPEPQGPVYALADDGTYVYVGGQFTSVNGGATQRGGLAETDRTTGLPTRNNLDTDGTVRSLLISGRTLFVGGAFTFLGALRRPYLGSIDLPTASPSPFNPQVDGDVDAMLARGSDLYIGGLFSHAGGVAHAGTAAFPIADGVPASTAWTPSANIVGSMAQRGATIYLADGTSTLKAVDDATGAPVPGFQTTVSGGGQIDSVAVAGDTLLLGGSFVSIDGVPRVNAGAVDAATGQVVAPWDPAPGGTGSVRALAATADGWAALGGDFTTTGAAAASGLASFTDAPVATGAPAIGGGGTATLTCGDVAFGGATPQAHDVAWLRDGAVIGGATDNTYTLTAADAGHGLSCRVTARNLGGSASADSASVAVPAAVGGGPLPGGGLGRAASDRTPPKISALTLGPASFTAARKGASIAAARKTKATKKPGTRISYRISEAARVTFSVQRPESGRRKGRTSCVKPTKKLARARRCTRYVAVKGTFTRTLRAAGTDHFTFTGRLGGRTLARGTYRLTLVAVDAAGNRAAPVTKTFKVTGTA